MSLSFRTTAPVNWWPLSSVRTDLRRCGFMQLGRKLGSFPPCKVRSETCGPCCTRKNFVRQLAFCLYWQYNIGIHSRQASWGEVCNASRSAHG